MEPDGASPSTGRLFDKVWDRHVVASPDGEPPLLYIDLHLVHEVTSPQAFEGLELAGRKVRRPDLTLATMDHDVPTIGPDAPDHRSAGGRADRGCATQLRRARRHAARARQHRAGHRARDRPAARPDPAGHDDRLRRQPHLHARRVRRAGVRHRHHRGRARARHPDAAPGQAEGDGRHRGRRPAARSAPPRTWCSASSRALGTDGGDGLGDRVPRRRRSARSRWKAG